MTDMAAVFSAIMVLFGVAQAASKRAARRKSLRIAFDAIFAQTPSARKWRSDRPCANRFAREGGAEELARKRQTHRIDAVSQAFAQMPLHGNSCPAKGVGGGEKRLGRDHLIRIAVDKKDRRSVA